MSSTTATTNGDAPLMGELVEAAACQYFGLRPVPWSHADAIDDDRDHGSGQTQIKGCQLEHSNGPGETVPGRWDVWRNELFDMLRIEGRYLLVVYDETADPANAPEFILAHEWLDPDELLDLIPDRSWHHAHRRKGRRARLSWTSVFDREELLEEGRP